MTCWTASGGQHIATCCLPSCVSGEWGKSVRMTRRPHLRWGKHIRFRSCLSLWSLGVTDGQLSIKLLCGVSARQWLPTQGDLVHPPTPPSPRAFRNVSGREGLRQGCQGAGSRPRTHSLTQVRCREHTFLEGGDQVP